MYLKNTSHINPYPIDIPLVSHLPAFNTCGFRYPALEPGSNAAACIAHATHHARRATGGPAGSAAGHGCAAALGGTGGIDLGEIWKT